MAPDMYSVMIPLIYIEFWLRLAYAAAHSQKVGLSRASI